MGRADARAARGSGAPDEGGVYPLPAAAAARRRRAESRSARVLAPGVGLLTGSPSLSRLRLRLPIVCSLEARHGVATARPRPSANGQPEEMRTRHHPISMPSSP